jgi:hypothetical protein
MVPIVVILYNICYRNIPEMECSKPLQLQCHPCMDDAHGTFAHALAFLRSKVLLTSTGMMRGTKALGLKAIADEALRSNPQVSKHAPPVVKTVSVSTQYC